MVQTIKAVLRPPLFTFTMIVYTQRNANHYRNTNRSSKMKESVGALVLGFASMKLLTKWNEQTTVTSFSSCFSLMEMIHAAEEVSMSKLSSLSKNSIEETCLIKISRPPSTASGSLRTTMLICLTKWLNLAQVSEISSTSTTDNLITKIR